VSEFFLRRRAELTNRAFITIANRLAGVRGRKNLVWVSSAFPLRFGTETFVSELDEATRAINSANIAIYAVDARGLTAPFANAAMIGEVRKSNHGRKADADLPPSMFEAEMRVRDTMMSLADATGGRTFSMGNDISKAIRLAVNDARLTYVLGYYPGACCGTTRFTR
jgi:VWFA-related protein